MTAVETHLDREQLELAQLQGLGSLLHGLIPANGFYTKKLSGPVGDYSGGLEGLLDKIPFTTKSEIVEDQQRNQPFGSNLTFPLDRYVRFNQTSGTTGVPIRWLDTAESWAWMVGCWERVFQASSVGPGDRIYFAF